MKFSHKLRKQRHAKPLPESIKTLGDWIRVNRIEKNLTPGHLALKIGIASALVCSWEDGTSQPDERQMEFLKKIFNLQTIQLEAQKLNLIPAGEK